MREEIPIPSSSSSTSTSPQTCSCSQARSIRISSSPLLTDIEEVGQYQHHQPKKSKNIMTHSSPPLRQRKGSSMRIREIDVDALDPSSIVDTLTLCACQQSRSFPYCDGTHKTFNKETGSSITPILVALVEDDGSMPRRADIRTSTHKTNSLPSLPLPPSSNTLRTSNNPSILYSSSKPPSPIPCIEDTSKPDTRTPPLPPPPSTTTAAAPKYKPSSIKDSINRANIFTPEEVAEHCTRESLWMTIKGNVYDITSYMGEHPGGERALLKFGGKDGTENVQFHSARMLELLNTKYYIGKLYREPAPSRCTIS